MHIKASLDLKFAAETDLRTKNAVYAMLADALYGSSDERHPGGLVGVYFCSCVGMFIGDLANATERGRKLTDLFTAAENASVDIVLTAEQYARIEIWSLEDEFFELVEIVAYRFVKQETAIDFTGDAFEEPGFANAA